jgi:hypothetical protein
MVWGAGRRILLGDFDAVVFNTVLAAGMVEMAVVEIVDMVIVFDGGVAAILTVLMVVMLTVFMIRHS